MNNFISIPELKSYLGILDNNQDGLLSLLRDGAEQMIKSYTNRNILAKSYTDYIDGEGQNNILLKDFPVNSITSFQKNTNTFSSPVWDDIDVDNYSLSGDNDGILYLYFNLVKGPKKYKIVYNAGYPEAPSDIKLATLKLIAKLKNSNDGIKTENVGGDTLEFLNELPQEVLIILNRYKNVC